MVQSIPPTTRSLAAARIDRYLMERSPQAGARSQQATSHQPVITISRALGVPGGEIAFRVAQELGFHLFDREVLDAVANSAQIGDRIVETLDAGKQSALDSWIRGCLNFDRRVVDTKSFHHMVSRVIRGISLHGAAVILGRGANFVLKGTDAFRVRLVAPLELRVRSVAEGVGVGEPMSLALARTVIEKHAADRRSFMRKHFRAEIEDPNVYDAVFNLRRLDPDHAAELIIAAYRRIAGPA